MTWWSSVQDKVLENDSRIFKHKMRHWSHLYKNQQANLVTVHIDYINDLQTKINSLKEQLDTTKRNLKLCHQTIAILYDSQINNLKEQLDN